MSKFVEQNDISFRPSKYAHKKRGEGAVRIAILSTGYDVSDPMIRGALRSGRIKDSQSWVGESADMSDSNGHGTHTMRLLLRVAPAAEISMAKISQGTSIEKLDINIIAQVSNHKINFHNMEFSHLTHLQAINWAVLSYGADIITIPLAFQDKDNSIDSELMNAESMNIIIFSASSDDTDNA